MSEPSTVSPSTTVRGYPTLEYFHGAHDHEVEGGITKDGDPATEFSGTDEEEAGPDGVMFKMHRRLEHFSEAFLLERKNTDDTVELILKRLTSEGGEFSDCRYCIRPPGYDTTYPQRLKNLAHRLGSKFSLSDKSSLFECNTSLLEKPSPFGSLRPGICARLNQEGEVTKVQRFVEQDLRFGLEKGNPEWEAAWQEAEKLEKEVSDLLERTLICKPEALCKKAFGGESMLRKRGVMWMSRKTGEGWEEWCKERREREEAHDALWTATTENS